METVRADRLAALRREIRSLQGEGRTRLRTATDLGLGPICSAFPDSLFPTGAIHEFVCSNRTDKSATTGFIAGLLSGLMQQQGLSVWVNAAKTVFPPALVSFGIDPSHIIFIDLPRVREVDWVIREALKYEGLSAVVGEMRDLDFTTSRRLQLAVEQSRVTGLLIRGGSRTDQPTAAVARWKIRSLPSESLDGLPGLGDPRWQVELLRVRNGRPGSWPVKWAEGKFRPGEPLLRSLPAGERKAG